MLRNTLFLVLLSCSIFIQAQDVFVQQFNPNTGKLEQVNQLGILPVIQYKIEF